MLLMISCPDVLKRSMSVSVFSRDGFFALQVCGYRLRLHFDGYSDCHDFWVNANSPDIHPPGWCENTGHKLHTPKGMEVSPSSLCNLGLKIVGGANIGALTDMPL